MTDRKPPKSPPGHPTFDDRGQRPDWRPRQPQDPAQPYPQPQWPEAPAQAPVAPEHYGGYPDQPRDPQLPDPHGYPQSHAQPYGDPQPYYDYGQPQAAPPAHRAHGGPPRKRRRRPPPKSNGFGALKIIGGVLAGILVLAGVGLAYLAYAFPTDAVRDQIIAQVKSKTGRDLTIAGKTSFAFYPSIGLSMRKVSLSPPPGMSGKPLVTMDGLDVSVQLIPLLSRDIRIDQLVLQKPVFELYTDNKGLKSWNFAQQTTLTSVRLAQAPAPASDAPGILPKAAATRSPRAASAAFDQLQFGDVRIVDGTVRYADAATGARHKASRINVQLALPAIDQPLDADGSLVWKGETITFDGALNSVKAVLDEKPANAAVTLAAAPLAARFEGAVAVRESIAADGNVSVKSPSVRNLAKWLGTELPRAKGYGPLDAKGQLRANAQRITLSNANIALDGATAIGEVSVNTSGKRPHVTGNLQVSVLDLNKYMRPGRAAGRPSPSKRKSGTKAPAKSIEDLLNAPPAKPGPKVRGYTQRAGWSNEAIDFATLGAVDANMKLAVGKLLYQEIKVGQSQLNVALKNSVIKTDFTDIQLYRGRGKGFITIDASQGRSATLGANISIAGLDALPFLKDAADFDKLSGKANLSVAVAGQGASQRQLIETLNGKAKMAFANGAINGINIPGMVRGISEGKLTGLGGSPSEKTDFSELTANWTIKRGIAHNNDLVLASPLLRVTGTGKVMLPARQVDYLMRPKLVSSLAGQGGKSDLAGLEIPVRVHGSWDKLKYSPDLEGVMKDPGKAIETVKEIGKKFKGKNAKDIVDGLFGGKSNGADTDGAAGDSGSKQQQPDVKSLLDNFLNQ